MTLAFLLEELSHFARSLSSNFDPLALAESSARLLKAAGNGSFFSLNWAAPHTFRPSAEIFLASNTLAVEHVTTVRSRLRQAGLITSEVSS
jgi:hypothetical protein